MLCNERPGLLGPGAGTAHIGAGPDVCPRNPPLIIRCQLTQLSEAPPGVWVGE